MDNSSKVFNSTNYVFIITDKNNIFWLLHQNDGFLMELKDIVTNQKEILGLLSQNDFELHVKAVEKRYSNTNGKY